MAFPADRLPVTVEIAPGGDPAADPGTWTWVDITSSVRLRDRIHITQGRADRSARVAPATCRLRLNNRTGNFTPRNPLGTWYGTLGRNTPLRVRLEWARDNFNRSVVSNGWGTSTSGHVWTTSGGAASDFSTTGSLGRQSYGSLGVFRTSTLDAGRGNVDIVIEIVNPVVPTGNLITHQVLGRYTDSSNNYLAALNIAVGGATTLNLQKRVAGVGSLISSSVSVGTHAAGNIWKIRFNLSGSTLRAKAWNVSIGASEPVAWQVEATDTSLTGGTRAGLQCRVESGNTNTLPVLIDCDNFVVTNDRFSGFVSSWPPRWDKSGRDATVPIEANGVLRRLGQGTPPAHSSIRRAVAVSNPVAYWPIEDGGEADQVASAIPGHPAMSVSGVVSFATVVDRTSVTGAALPIGSLPVADLKGGGSLSVSIPAAATTAMASAWAIQCLSRNDVGLTASNHTVLMEWTTPGGTFVRWQLVVETAAALQHTKVIVYDSAGTPTTAADLGSFQTAPTFLRVTAEQSGGNINVKLYHTTNDSPSASGTVAGTLTGPATLVANATGVTNTAAVPFGHLTFWATATPAFGLSIPTDSYGVFIGTALIAFFNETVRDRLVRLCAEEGVSLSAPAVSAAFVTRMGAQPASTFLDLLQECSDADQGVLYESGFALGYLPRETRYNRAVSLALDFDRGQVAEPPEPTDDDQQLRNRVTVRRTDGSSAVAEDTDSIASHGLYQEEVTVNHADDSGLENHAAWRVHLGA